MRVNEIQLYRLLSLMAQPRIGAQAIARLFKLDATLESYFVQGQLKPQVSAKSGAPLLFRVDEMLKRCVEWMDKNSARHIICMGDIEYPPLLTELSDPPPLLFVKGNIESLLSPQLSIVGTRRASSQGLQNAYTFGRRCAEQGLTITSGLALGIDAKAHEGALAAPGLTVAILAGGLEHISPRQHIPLAVKILRNEGAIVSEKFPWQEPFKHDFIRRNRIISGLSGGVVVVEAPHKSGAMKTAFFALEQNRDVYAMPGNINNPQVKGCHELIRQGAILADDVEAVLEHFPWQMTKKKDAKMKKKGVENENFTNNEAQVQVLDRSVQEAIGWEMTPIDRVVNQTGLSIEKVNQAVASLLIAGHIAPVPGGYARIMR